MARLTKRAWLAGAVLAAACAGSSPAGPSPVVTGPVALGLRVLGVPAELSPGDTVQLKAEVFLGGGARKECAASWAVDDPRVVTVSPTGLMTAGLTGYAIVTASCAGLSNTAQVRVAAANPYQLIIVAYDSEVPSEFGVVWPVRVRFTAVDFAPKDFVLAESTGTRRNSKSPLFDFRVPMTFVPDAQTDTYVRTMSREVMEISHPFTMRQAGPVQVRTWWSVDYNDRLFLELWCNGEMLATRTQIFGSAGSGFTQDAPAGSCETRLRQSKSDAGTHYRVAIKYAR